MSEEIYKFKGRLAEKDNQATNIRVQMSGLVRLLRDLLDPFEKCEELETLKIEEQAHRLAVLQGDLKKCLEDISAIKKALGYEHF